MEPGLIFRQLDDGAVRLCSGMGSVSRGSKIARSLSKSSHLLYSEAAGEKPVTCHSLHLTSSDFVSGHHEPDYRVLSPEFSTLQCSSGPGPHFQQILNSCSAFLCTTSCTWLLTASAPATADTTYPVCRICWFLWYLSTTTNNQELSSKFNQKQYPISVPHKRWCQQ